MWGFRHFSLGAPVVKESKSRDLMIIVSSNLVAKFDMEMSNIKEHISP